MPMSAATSCRSRRRSRARWSAIDADDTQFVNAGQPLVELDRADAKVALDQAEAQLAKTVREVRTLFATSAQLQAGVEVHQSDVARANEDLARRERLASSGAISREELQHARNAANGAQSALLAAQQELAANRARVDRTTLDNHPDVRDAAAQVREAYLAYARTELPAPVSGFVAKRSVQLGQRVSPGTPLMAIVPLDQVWVDANFKEPQLANMRVGQPVTLTADLYGGRVDYHGKVAGFGAGTGSAFALLPAQNATGNWIKIVQRVPGAHRARSAGARRRIRCRSVCRCRSTSTRTSAAAIGCRSLRSAPRRMRPTCSARRTQPQTRASRRSSRPTNRGRARPGSRRARGRAVRRRREPQSRRAEVIVCGGAPTA